MKVTRMRRGWRVSCTDNEYEMLREAVNRGLAVIDMYGLDERLPYKVRKAMTARWSLPHGPLIPDEDRRHEETAV